MVDPPSESAAGQRPVAVILAGGANSRFWPLREKSLLWLCGESLLARQVRLLADAGVTDTIVVGNPANADALRAELAHAGRGAAHVVVQPEPRGMGDALLHARPLLAERFTDRPVLICQVHDVTEQGLLRRLVEAADGDADGWIVGQRVDRYFPGGYLTLEGDRVTGIVEKPGQGREPSDLVSLVLHVLRDPAELFAALSGTAADDTGGDDHYERALASLMRRGDVRLVRYDGRWQPIKYPWHVLDAMEFLLGEVREPRISPDVRLGPGAQITGPVVVEPGVRLFAHAQVVGPAYVGTGAILGNNVLVRGSAVGPGCIVGINSEVARSYVGARCEFHENYVGDSVVAAGASFGAGAITGNLRLNERPIRSVVKGEVVDTGRAKLGAICGERARLGINAMLMPGVKVGQDSAVGPGVILLEDLPDRTRVLVKQELIYGPSAPVQGDRTAFRSKLPLG